MDYFSGQRNLFCKVKIIVSSFFGFLFCASSFRFPMRTQKQGPVVEAVQFSISGLKTLICSEEGEEKVINRVIRRGRVGVRITRSKLLTHSSSSSSSIRSCNLLMDDLIGTESGVCLTSNAEDQILQQKLLIHSDDSDHRYHRTNQERCKAKKQFPPPIPFLAGQAGHRTWPPWILTRNCTDDGRLILKLERVRHHQYLESYRDNGRLILNLVPAPVAGGTDIEDDDRDLQFIEEDEGKDHQTKIESIECEEATDPEMAFKSFTYGGGMFCDREPFCGVNNGNFEERHFGSAPLRPMGTVM